MNYDEKRINTYANYILSRQRMILDTLENIANMHLDSKEPITLEFCIGTYDPDDDSLVFFDEESTQMGGEAETIWHRREEHLALSGVSAMPTDLASVVEILRSMDDKWILAFDAREGLDCDSLLKVPLVFLNRIWFGIDPDSYDDKDRATNFGFIDLGVGSNHFMMGPIGKGAYVSPTMILNMASPEKLESRKETKFANAMPASGRLQ